MVWKLFTFIALSGVLSAQQTDEEAAADLDSLFDNVAAQVPSEEEGLGGIDQTIIPVRNPVEAITGSKVWTDKEKLARMTAEKKRNEEAGTDQTKATDAAIQLSKKIAEENEDPNLKMKRAKCDIVQYKIDNKIYPKSVMGKAMSKPEQVSDTTMKVMDYAMQERKWKQLKKLGCVKGPFVAKKPTKSDLAVFRADKKVATEWERLESTVKKLTQAMLSGKIGSQTFSVDACDAKKGFASYIGASICQTERVYDYMSSAAIGAIMDTCLKVSKGDNLHRQKMLRKCRVWASRRMDKSNEILKATQAHELGILKMKNKGELLMEQRRAEIKVTLIQATAAAKIKSDAAKLNSKLKTLDAKLNREVKIRADKLRVNLRLAQNQFEKDQIQERYDTKVAKIKATAEAKAQKLEWDRVAITAARIRRDDTRQSKLVHQQVMALKAAATSEARIAASEANAARIVENERKVEQGIIDRQTADLANASSKLKYKADLLKANEVNRRAICKANDLKGGCNDTDNSCGGWYNGCECNRRPIAAMCNSLAKFDGL